MDTCQGCKPFEPVLLAASRVPRHFQPELRQNTKRIANILRGRCNLLRGAHFEGWERVMGGPCSCKGLDCAYTIIKEPRGHNVKLSLFKVSAGYQASEICAALKVFGKGLVPPGEEAFARPRCTTDDRKKGRQTPTLFE